MGDEIKPVVVCDMLHLPEFSVALERVIGLRDVTKNGVPVGTWVDTADNRFLTETIVLRKDIVAAMRLYDEGAYRER